MGSAVYLSVRGFADSDDRERTELSRDLRRSLEREAVSVRGADGDIPPGAKGPVLDVAQLVLASGTSLSAVVGAVIAWSHRHRGASVKVSIGDDSIELSQVTKAQQDDLIRAFIDRHDTP